MASAAPPPAAAVAESEVEPEFATAKNRPSVVVVGLGIVTVCPAVVWAMSMAEAISTVEAAVPMEPPAGKSPWVSVFERRVVFQKWRWRLL
jgi:hypothetical protein